MKRLKPNGDRARTAIIFLWISIGSLGFILIAELYQAYVISQITGGNYSYDIIDAANRSDMIFLVATLLNFVIYITTAVVFIMWFRRAYFNLHQIKKNGLRMTEGWAAGAWFVPIYNLWGPFNIATDLFTHTEKVLIDNDLTESQPSRQRIKGYWWTLWVIVAIVGGVESQLTRNAGFDAEMILTGKMIGIVATLITIPCGLLAIKMIKSYNEMEVLLPRIEDVKADIGIDDSELLDSSL